MGVADSETAAVLLDEFEHRVDAMIEISGGSQAVAGEVAAAAPVAEPAPEPEPEQPAAEADQVPTVSGVVSQLGPQETAAEADRAEPPQTSVAMLTAMVEALSASIPAAEPEPEQAAAPEPEQAVMPEAEQAAAPEPEAIAPEPEPEPEPTAAPEPEQAASEPEQAAPAEPVALEPAFDAALPVAALAQESSLLASLERMEARPFPPPDEGTAVIFTRPGPNLLAMPMPEPPAVQQAEPEPMAATPAAGPDSVAPAQMDVAAADIPATEALAEFPPAAPEPEAMAADADAVPPEPEAQAADPDFDPADFLFGPEPEPDPAAFLLDPPPAPVSQPQQALAPRDAAADDPLRAIKAMSPEERLAVFS
jgi:hypothetical protein